MADDNVVEKVAARLSLDISPGQEKLNEFAEDFEQFKDKAAQTYSLFGKALLEATTQNGAAMQELSATDQAKILQIQQDGELKRQMASMAFQQQIYQQQQEFGARMQSLESEAQSTREALAHAAAMQTMAVLAQAEVQKSAILEESALKQQALEQKIAQTTEINEAKLSLLKSQSAREYTKWWQDALKEVENLDKAHYQALLENEKRSTADRIEVEKEYTKFWSDALKEYETFDTAHYQALQENQKRYLTEKQAADKEYTQFWTNALKEQEAIDKAHYQALRDDRATLQKEWLAAMDAETKQREDLDRAHAGALLENARRDSQDRLALEKEYTGWWQAELKQREAIDKAHWQALQDDAKMAAQEKLALDKEYSQWWSETLKQMEALDKAHYQAIQADRDRDATLQKQSITTEMAEIKAFYDMKLSTAEESLARIQELLSVEAQYFAENQNQKLQLMKMESSIRQDVTNQELAIDQAFVRALQENRDLELQDQDEMISRKLQKIKSYYDIELITAKDALKQVEELMDQETTYFQANQDKQLQAMKMAYQMRNDLKAQQLTGGLPEGMGNFLGNAASFASGMAMFAVLNQLMQIPHTIEDISASMTKLKQVLELSDQIKSVQQLDDSLNQLQGVGEQMAVIYGQNVSTVLDVMTEAGRRFKDLPSIIVATDNALQVMTADNVNATKAIKGEEAMMSQFGLTIGETRDAWAKITVAAHEFQANASDIIDGLERSGSAFNGMKIQTDGSIASLVALQQESGRTGAVVGNSWKSIENTLGSDKGVKALHDLGIEARASNGALEDGLTVLGELQKKWPELSEASRVAFATTLAGGKYQYQQLLTFLDNTSGTFTRALDAMNKATVQQQEQLVESAMQSLPKQQQMMVAALQAMTAQFGQSLTPALIQFYTEVRNGTRFVSDHVQTIETLIGMGMKLAEGYVAWKVGLQLYNAVVDSAIVKQAKLTASIVESNAVASGASKGFATLKGAIIGVADAAAVTVGRLAILAAAAEVFNNIAARQTDPLGEKEKDLQAQLESLQQRKQDEQQNGTGIWSGIVQGWDFFKEAGANILNPQRAGAIGSAYSNNDKSLDSQIASVKQQLAGIQKQKDDQQKADFEKYQKMIDDAMKAADNNHLPPPPLGNGSDTTMPGSSASQSAAAYSRTFSDSIKSMEDDLGPLNNISKELDTALSTLSKHQETLNNSLKYGSTNTQIASDAFQVYSQRLSAYKTQRDSLHTTNEQIRSDLSRIAAEMQAINPTSADPTTLSQGQQDALSKLSSEYDKLNTQLDQNSQKWQEDAKGMVSAADDWANSIKQLQANALASLDRQLKDIENQLKSTQAQMSMDKNKMDHGDTSLATLTDYAKQYQDQLNELGQKEQTLSQEHATHAKQLNDLQYAYNNLDKSSAGYDEAAQNLTEQIDAQKSALADLDDQMSQTAASVQSLKDSYEQLIEDGLKAGYEAEQKLQDQELQDKYDAKIKALTNQKDAVDALINSLQQQWQMEDANAKLADLEKQDANVRSQLDHVIVNADGTVSRTYDTQKDADLQKQIADQKTKIARDQQKQQLEDQKSALEAQIKQLQDEYQKEKDALDAYWTYRLQQDQLKQETERLAAQKGYAKALTDAQTFRDQMNATFAQINWAQIQQGEGIGGSLPGGGKGPGGQTGAGSAISNLEQILSAAGANWQLAKTQSEKDAIHHQILQQMKGTGAAYNDKTGEWSLNGTILNGVNAGKIAAAETGAYIPDNREGLIYLHPNEVVANSPLVDNFKMVPAAIADMKAKIAEMPRVYAGQLLASHVAQTNIKNSSQNATTIIQKGKNTFHVAVYADDSSSVKDFVDLIQTM